MARMRAWFAPLTLFGVLRAVGLIPERATADLADVVGEDAIDTVELPRVGRHRADSRAVRS